MSIERIDKFNALVTNSIWSTEGVTLLLSCIRVKHAVVFFYWEAERKKVTKCSHAYGLFRMKRVVTSTNIFKSA